MLIINNKKTINKPSQDVIYDLLQTYQYEPARINSFRRASVNHNILTDHKIDAYLEGNITAERERAIKNWVEEMNNANTFLSEKSLNPAEKQQLLESMAVLKSVLG